MTLFGFLAFLVVLGIVGTVVGAIVSPSFRRTLNIFGGRANNKLTSPIEREMALIEEQEAIVRDGSRKASDIRGTLNAERTKLQAAEDAVASADSDLKLAISMATKAAKAANPSITDDALTAAINGDAMVLQQAENKKAALAQRDIQAKTVASLEKTVATTKSAVEDAQRKLQELKLSATSDAAKAKATSALSSAAGVVDTFKGLSSVGAKLQKEHDAVDEQFEQANARLEDAQGPQAQRDFEAAKRQQSLADLIGDARK